MIKSWKHKGLEKFYKTGSKRGIRPEHAARLTSLLQLLNAAEAPEMMDLPGFHFHALSGNFKAYYSVRVSANWRIIFQFEKENAILVDYLDYH